MRFLLLGACLILALSGAAAAADWLRPDVAYSATRTMRAGGQEVSGPLHYDSGKERFEMTVEGQQQVMIRREDRQAIYMVMPQMGMAMEMRMDGPEAPPSAGDYADLQPEEMGRETLDGEEVTKYRVAADDAGGSYTVFIWATDDGIPLRIEGSGDEGSFEMVLSDLQRGPQPADLFEVPAGVQMMQMPGQ